MKIQCISFGSYSNNMSITPDIAGSNREFLYYPKKNEEHNYKPLILKILGSFAAIAVGVTLYNLRKNKVPLSVVDIEDKSKGLNSINFRRTAIELKKKILYPIKTETTNKKGTFNTGLILSDTKDKPLKEVLSSFSEHAEALGIRTKEIPDNLNKPERRKWVFNTIKEAENHYKETNQFTIINIGNLDNLVDLKIVKAKNSAIEDKLIEINKNVYSGIVWTAWTNNTKSIPMYYNNLPVLVTKLID